MKEGWKYEPLGSVGKFKRGGNFKKSDFVDDGMPCVHYGQIHMTFGTSTNQHLSAIPQSIYDKCTKGEKGDLLIAITSEDVEGSCKCTAWTGDYAVALGGHMARFRHNLNPLYVSYFFQSPTFQRAKKEYTHGFKVIEIKPSDIAKITIGYPSPEEQAVIVAKLDAVFAKIDRIKDNARRALDEAILIFDTALNAIFSDNYDWEEHRLDELCSIESKLVDPTSECFAKIPHIGGANITSTTGHLIDVKAVEDEDLSSGKYFFEKNVVLYNKIRPYLKKIALPTTCGLCSADMYPLTPKKGTDREFLRFLLLTKHFTDYAISGSARAGMPKVNRKYLFAYSCYTPSLEKQKLIALNLRSLLSDIEKLQENAVLISMECESLKQAILKQFFEKN